LFTAVFSRRITIMAKVIVFISRELDKTLPAADTIGR